MLVAWPPGTRISVVASWLQRRLRPALPPNLSCLAALLALAALSACAAPPPPIPPTVLKLKIVASADVNATQAGQGAPVLLRIYQLGSAAAFEKAEFFRLNSADTATLGADIVKKDEYLIVPGATKEETLTLPDNVKAVGFFAAYREFQKATWRATVAPEAHKTTAVAVTVNASGLSAAPAP